MKWFTLTSGILTLLIGFWIFANPLVVTASIGWLLALIIFLAGITGFMNYMSKPSEERNSWNLLQSVISIIFGFILLTSSIFSLTTAVVTIAAYWILVIGILRLISAYRLRQAGVSTDNHLLITGIFALVIGLILLGQPLLSSAIIGRFVALLLIAVGLSSLFTFWQLR
ncbi:HdeD family acid-resistance protein [Streptococcus orisasini]